MNAVEGQQAADSGWTGQLALDIALCIAASILSPALILAFDGYNWLRLLVGVPYLLFLPGYLLTCALWARHGELSAIERVAYSFGLSIGLAAIIAIVLSVLTAFELSWLLLLVSSTSLALAAIAAIRRHLVPSDSRLQTDLPTVKIVLFGKSRRDTSYTVITIIVAALVVAAVIANFPPPGKAPEVTQFYVLDLQKRAVNYPVNVTVGQPNAVWVGLHNGEGAQVAYRIAVSYENLATNKTTNVASFSGNLTSGNSLERMVNYTFQRSGNYIVRFALNLNDNATPYATLHINAVAKT